MSLSDCEKCGETPCLCGYEYESWETEKVRKLRDLLSALVVRREGGEARRFESWELPRCGVRRVHDGARCVLREGHSGGHL